MHPIIFFLTGIIVGVMNAVAGGGMLVGFPVLIALGIPPLMATATGSLITLPGQLTSAFGYRQYLTKVPRRFALLIIPLVIGGFAGAQTLRHTSPDKFESIVPVLVLLGVGLFTVQPLIHFHLKQHLRGKHRTITPLFWISLALLPVAFYGGYFGPGIGFMLLAFLSFTRPSDIHTMSAMKNVGATSIAVTSFICLSNSGLINWQAGLVMAAGTAVGGYSGSRYSQRISSHWLRIIVITIGFSAVAYLGFKQY